MMGQEPLVAGSLVCQPNSLYEVEDTSPLNSFCTYVFVCLPTCGSKKSISRSEGKR